MAMGKFAKGLMDMATNPKALQVSAKSLPANARGVKTTLAEFTKAWAKLCAAYPRTAVGSATLTIYWERLRMYDLARLTAAFEVAIDTKAFFPTVAEVRHMISDMAHHEPHKVEQRPEGEELERVKVRLAELVKGVGNHD